jgi:hypothetical protein
LLELAELEHHGRRRPLEGIPELGYGLPELVDRGCGRVDRDLELFGL